LNGFEDIVNSDKKQINTPWLCTLDPLIFNTDLAGLLFFDSTYELPIAACYGIWLDKVLVL
jgi:hypothetical protein